MGQPTFQMAFSTGHFREWECLKFSCLDGNYGLVISKDEDRPICPVWTIKPLNISNYWVIRKIQLWAIKKTFK